jgi:hypothetical protein
MSNIDRIALYLQFCHVFTSLQKRVTLGIELDLRNYKAPAVTYLFPIV